MDFIQTLLSNTENLALVCLFAIPAIGVTFFQSLKAYFRHRERIELIQQGIHPDFNESDDEDAQLQMSVKAR